MPEAYRTAQSALEMKRDRSLYRLYIEKFSVPEMGMAKRWRTKGRTDEFYQLALRAHAEGWSRSRVEEEIDHLIDTNPDLVEIGACSQARREVRIFANPKLAGVLGQLYECAERRMALEPAGTKRRFNHELRGFCEQVIKHPVGAAAALHEIQRAIESRTI